MVFHCIFLGKKAIIITSWTFLWGPFHGVQNEYAVATGTRGSAEDIVSVPKGPCGRDRLGPNCFVTLETIRHPLSRGLFFVCHVWKMFSWNPCKTLLKKIVTVNRKLSTVYVRLPWSAPCLQFDNRVKLFPHKLVITQWTLVEILVTLISLKCFS